MLQALHRDVGADVLEVLRLAEGGVEDCRLGAVSGRRTRRGDQSDRHCPRPVDDVGELPGRVLVEGGRAQHKIRLVLSFGHLVRFQQAFAQIAQRVRGLLHVGDPRGGQQLRQVLAEPDGDDLDVACPRPGAGTCVSVWSAPGLCPLWEALVLGGVLDVPPLSPSAGFSCRSPCVPGTVTCCPG
ncbi:hypothetical protein ACFV2U_46710 [Streptomyces sp. NPDC059697]|uniref:hypothetical protein n=1 Tax=Streptomyces sp. NPDC059697 TaxID=3346912 RepID=UPI0036CA7A88